MWRFQGELAGGGSMSRSYATMNIRYCTQRNHIRFTSSRPANTVAGKIKQHCMTNRKPTPRSTASPNCLRSCMVLPSSSRHHPIQTTVAAKQHSVGLANVALSGVAGRRRVNVSVICDHEHQILHTEEPYSV